tara:strand:- start:223 stop:1371 length:1149 start_codon:yes stop_codon:yes gene_type:complete
MKRICLLSKLIIIPTLLLTTPLLSGCSAVNIIMDGIYLKSKIKTNLSEEFKKDSDDIVQLGDINYSPLFKYKWWFTPDNKKSLDTIKLAYEWWNQIKQEENHLGLFSTIDKIKKGCEVFDIAILESGWKLPKGLSKSNKEDLVSKCYPFLNNLDESKPPKFPAILLERGSDAWNSNNLDEVKLALEDIELLHKYFPEIPHFLIIMMRYKSKLLDYEGVLIDSDKLLDLYKYIPQITNEYDEWNIAQINLYELYETRAIAKTKLKDLEGAIKERKSYMSINDTSKKGIYEQLIEIGKLRYKQGQYKQAIEVLKNALAIDDDNSFVTLKEGELYYFLALSKLELGDKVGACSDLNSGSRTFTQPSRAYLNSSEGSWCPIRPLGE